LVVHHKDRNRKNNTTKNLETLCQLCHIQEHREEVAASQRCVEVNARRGASVSTAKLGKTYPKVAEVVRDNWKGAVGAKLREIHQSEKVRSARSAMMKKLMNDPAHVEKRRRMKEERKLRGE